jgi:general secretion pathway protein A
VMNTWPLRRNPFNMTPDPAFLFLTPQHREALVGLTYALLEHKGFVVLTGEAGTGKTTLLARVLQALPSSQLQSSVIMNPTLTPAEFLELALLDFGVNDIPASKAQRLWVLQKLLMEGQKQRKVSALIVDEAHKLSPELLEEIRLLGNFESADRKLLQVLLLGQSELDKNLNREDLRQFKQRIALRLHIGALSAPEVGEYIQHRWLIAGGGTSPFSSEAVLRIAETSRGIPRIINGLCDNALTLAFGEGSNSVDVRHVLMAATDLHLVDLLPRPAPVAVREAPPKPPVKTLVTETVVEQLRGDSKPEQTNQPVNGVKLLSRWADRFGFASRNGSSG